MTREQADEIFEEYPNMEEFYATADGYIYPTPAKAQSHADRLEEKSVEKWTRVG